MAACGSYGIKCDPEMSFQPDCYPPVYQCEQQVVHEPTGEMDLAGFLEMDDKILSELAAGGNKQPTEHSEWTSLFDDVLDPSTGLPLMGHPVAPLSPTLGAAGMTAGGGGGGVPHMDGWVLEETKKLEAQQRIQQRKLLDLKQTLIKTEILKNQLQIHASISQQQQHLQHQHQHQQLSPPPLHSVPSPISSAPNNTATSPPALLPSLTTHSGSALSYSPTTGVTSVVMGDGQGKTPKLPISRLTSGTGSIDDSKETRMSISQDDSSPDSPPQDPEKRKVHNLIEKKYRSSINDRIGLLRDMVSKHSKDNKKLQKSAVLQKTIDFIHHLEGTIKRLQEENRQLKEMLAKATGQQTHMATGYTQSPPVTPPSVSPRSSVSGEDSGVPPSSPDCDSGNSSPSSQPSYLTSHHLLHPSLPSSTMPHLLMCVLLVAVFFVNPLYFTGHHSHIIGGHTPGGMRTLSSIDDPSSAASDGYVVDVVWWGLAWLLRLLVAAVCFGWLHVRSVAPYDSTSSEGVKFWRFWKQAQQDLHKGEYGACRDSVESALTVIGRPVPTSSFSLAISLVWSTLSHLFFQVFLGRVGVYLASLLEKKVPLGRLGADYGKKQGFRVTSSEVAQAYHLLHQLNMTAPGPEGHLKGLGLYFSLCALNFAETDRPNKRLPGPVVAEMYLSLGLQSSLSLPYASSSLAMWYYLFRSRNQSPSQLPAQLKWTVTPRGKHFLQSGKWEAEVKIGSRLYHGPAALPLYSVTRAFCKELLCEAFNSLLLPPPPTSPTQPSTDTTLEELKYVLGLAREATSSLLPCHTRSCDSGFAPIQWWASLGLVACHWTAGEDPEAEAYYSAIEGMLGDSTSVPTALHLAFKALRLHKHPRGNQAPPTTSTLLQLCRVTSNALETCVADVLQDHSDSIENELHQLGLLLACDWLLELRIALWEGDGNKAEGVGREVAPGFYQDLDTLAKLVSLLPSALPRLRLYKGCYQLMAGANPMQAQNMLNSTGRSSLLRRRGLDKEWKKVNSPAMFSHEQAMAQLLAYKHLPPSLDPAQQDMPPSSPHS